MDKKKHTGSYYTPSYLASFISKRVLSHFEKEVSISILEPSVGDGAFVEEINKENHVSISFDALDINGEELQKAKSQWSHENSKFTQVDFLQYESDQKYSVVIGNPPYIKKNLLSEDQLVLCKQIHFSNGLSDKSVKNIWTTFVIKSNQLLAQNGVLAFVLPSELLQVKFAEEVREYLKREFQRIEVFTFNDLMFECKGQDTIVLFAYKNHEAKGEYFTNITQKEQLIDNSFNLNQNNLLVESNVKWTHHFLDYDEITFLNTLKAKIKPINHYTESKPGIVTAANSFFVIDKQTEKEYNLHSYTKPIIQKGYYVNGSVVFNNDDFSKLEESKYPSRLLQLDDNVEITPELKKYLHLGEKQDIPQRYKCRIRNNWFVIPNISTRPEAFFFKRSHHYPKLLKNETEALVTDSAYKVNVRDGYNLNSLIYSFYNSLTLAFAEIDGRYYGGGVLELTPNEFKNLPLPYMNQPNHVFDDFVSRFEKKTCITDVLKDNDTKILGETLNLSLPEIEIIQRIRQKLVDKRMR